MRAANEGPTITPVLEIEGLCKSYGSSQVLRDASFKIERGQVVGLLGPNGAGKSTLIKSLTGVTDADRGIVRFMGKPVKNLAGQPEVGAIHQDFGVIDDMTVLENMRLGATPLKIAGPFLSLKQERAAVKQALERVGLDIPTDALAGSLAPAERAIMAVARTLDFGAHFLILDEATANLSHQDSRRLMQTITERAEDAGTTVLLVTHKLTEIVEWADRAIVLIDGSVVRDSPVEGNIDGIVDDLTPEISGGVKRPDGRRRSRAASEASSSSVASEVALAFRNVTTKHVGPVSFDLHAGEAFGFIGAASSGIHEIAKLAIGDLRPESGERSLSSNQRVSYLPGNREVEGSFEDMSVLQNMTVTSLNRWQTTSRLLRLGRERSDANAMAARLRVRPSNVDFPQSALSGGNQQKVLFGRCLFEDAKVLVVCDPTRGLDVRTRFEMYDRINEHREKGLAVLVLSSDADDVLQLCDRVAVVDDGGVGPLEPIEKFSVRDLELMV